MAQIVSKSILVAQGELLEFVRGCLAKAGLPEADARLVADSLVASNLRGIDSHGVARLPHYLNRIKHGSINPRPQIKAHQHGPALARVDGDHAMGQLAMQRATEEAIALARSAGAGWVAVENSTHCGALAFFALEIARAGMIALAFSHSDSFVVPFGGKYPFCGTNPLCFAAPAENGKAMCLDMATSVVPWNTISNAAIEGVTIPEGWAVDSEGKSTTDPKAAKAVLPFGDYKGSGLGLMVDVFCTALLGSPFGPGIAAMYGDPAKQRLLGGLVGAIDISKFRPVDDFRRTITEMMRQWNAQERAQPDEPILYPGQPEEMERERRLAKGIPVGVNLVAIFAKLSAELGVPWHVETN